MSTKCDGDSNKDTSTEEECSSSDDGYSEDEFEYRHFCNPIMSYIPKEQQSTVRKLAKDTARVIANEEPIRRMVRHYAIFQQKKEICMQENCNKWTYGKCGTCHVILCLDSVNDCFSTFHNTC